MGNKGASNAPAQKKHTGVAVRLPGSCKSVYATLKVILQLIGLGLLLIFPQMALWLPEVLR